MKKLIAILLVFCMVPSVYAVPELKKRPNLPQGTFKKKKNGDVIQLDSKGKKIGIYRVKNGKYVKVK